MSENTKKMQKTKKIFYGTLFSSILLTLLTFDMKTWIDVDMALYTFVRISTIIVYILFVVTLTRLIMYKKQSPG